MYFLYGDPAQIPEDTLVNDLVDLARYTSPPTINPNIIGALPNIVGDADAVETLLAQLYTMIHTEDTGIKNVLLDNGFTLID